MLRFLSIKRLAVIDAVEVEFGPGLNVLTGETGAGKSILVEAVGLLLGGRATADLVRTGEDTASIDAIFDIAGQEFLVRRELTAQGRSRAFINGELVTASALKELSERLIELHGQHEHQTLLDPTSHLAAIDAFGGLDGLTAQTATAFDRLRSATAALDTLRRGVADRAARQELAAFQLGELDRPALRPGEDEELAAARRVLASAERVERLCLESYSVLYENDDAILAALGTVWRNVAELAALDPQFLPHLEARDAVKPQLEDLAMFLRRYADNIEASPARLQQVEERLALLERLKRKYGPTLADVLAKRDALKRDLDDFGQSDERLADLTRDHAMARDAYLSVATSLSAARRTVAVDLSDRLERELAELAMSGTKFEVRFEAEPILEAAWCAQGIDRAEFFLSPNPGEDLRPLARIVSGGELSRVMLAIKTLTVRGRLADARVEAGENGAPGVIFDEVDAGIGGRVADVVGQKLRALGSAFQVLCITHLPQIAAAADSHFQIDKIVEHGRTRTLVARLDDNGRVEELSRMLAGSGVTDAVRASAREMLGRRKAKGESEGAKAKPQDGKPRRTPRI